MRSVKVFIVIGMLLGIAASAWAQGNPTGTIRGQIMDPGNLPLPGVTITAASPAMQGTRSAVTSTNGDFIIPFLPPGDYTVTIELQGFQQQKKAVSVAMADTQPFSITLALAGVQETVTVTASAQTEVLTTSTVAETYRKDMLERLPLGRDLAAAVTLAPGVTPTGPSGNIIMSGALSFETQYLVNGVVINENLRGQALNLFIEDAVQETKVSTASISAEYGRFGGGVVNMITKSGGNMFSGSFRTTFNNDAWRALTPDANDKKVNKITPVYEATLGGPILKDRLWFFSAVRYTKPETNVTLRFTGYNYTFSQAEPRYELKGTYAINQKNKIMASYMKRTTQATNTSFGVPMDKESLYNPSTNQNLMVFNYTSVLSNNLFLEGQYSRRISATMDTGSQFSDRIKGTLISDRSRLVGTSNPTFNSPTFCAVCYDSTGVGWLEHRDNWDWYVKLSYFLSTQKTGSHNFAFGFDNFKEWRKNNNWQSGSAYSVSATSAIIDGTNIYPVFKNDNTTFIDWTPLVKETVGNDIRTYSAYANDSWRFNNRLSFNIGARFDINRSSDQAGTSVVKDSQWSPRVGVTYDLKGDGKWTVNAAYSRYVSGISTALVDAGSAGGRTADYSWYYKGPNVNTGAGPYVTSAQALTTMWAWFDAAGGNNMATRSAPSIPGVSTKVKDGVKSPSSNEFSVGVANQLGQKGIWRVDYVYRKAADQYGDFLDMSTGTVQDPAGRSYNLVLVGNTSMAQRTYQAMVANVSYRIARVTMAANYTLGKMWGNVNGENVGSGPIRASIDTYPEYRAESWDYPMGYNPGDQRHKFRGMVVYQAPIPQSIGMMDIGFVQRFDSGVSSPGDPTGSVDTRPYVTNPGYLSPISSVGYYFLPRGSFRWDNVWTTDLSVNWSKRLGVGSTQVFFRGVVTNVFNSSAVVNGNIVINTNYNNKTYATFNPFTTAPVRGVNWDLGPTFGKPAAPADYQSSRQFSFSVGLRF